MFSPHLLARPLLAAVAACVLLSYAGIRHACSDDARAMHTELWVLPSVVQPEEKVGTVAHQETSNPAENALPGPLLTEETIALPPGLSAELTLEQLEQMALANNPSIARATAEIRALRGKWVQVGLPSNPTVGYLASEIGDGGAAGQQGGFLGQEYVTGDKLCLNRQVVAQEIRRGEQRLAAQQQRVRTDVRVAYYTVLTAQRKLDLAEELAEVNSNAVEASQKLFQAQEISRSALLQAEVEQSSTTILQQRAQNELHSSWRQLSAVVGSAAELHPQRLAGNLDAVLGELSWDEQLTRLMSESPEIAEAVAELQRTRWALDRACAEVRPNVNTQVSVQYDDGTKFTIAGVQIGVPLPLWNRNQGGIRQARAEIAAAQENIERVELDLKFRLSEAFRAYADARFQVESFSTEILPKARQTLTLVQNGYQRGEVGYLDLLTAERTYSQTSLSHIEAQRALWQSTVQIEGLLLERSLQERQ